MSGFTLPGDYGTPAYEARAKADREAELMDRLARGLPLTKVDAAEARRLFRAAKARS